MEFIRPVEDNRRNINTLLLSMFAQNGRGRHLLINSPGKKGKRKICALLSTQ